LNTAIWVLLEIEMVWEKGQEAIRWLPAAHRFLQALAKKMLSLLQICLLLRLLGLQLLLLLQLLLPLQLLLQLLLQPLQLLQLLRLHCEKREGLRL